MFREFSQKEFAAAARNYQGLLQHYEEKFGKGEDNPFYRHHFDEKEGEYRTLHLAVGCARGVYELFGHDPERFDELVAFLVRAMFPRHLATCAAARALKEHHW